MNTMSNWHNFGKKMFPQKKCDATLLPLSSTEKFSFLVRLLCKLSNGVKNGLTRLHALVLNFDFSLLKIIQLEPS